jgi:nucleoid-associated protein YgaU
MTSRVYLAVAMIGLVAGVGWGAYELHKRAPVAPTGTTMTPEPAPEVDGGGALDAPTGRAETPAGVTILGAGQSDEAAAIAKAPPGTSEAATATAPPKADAGDRAGSITEQPDPASRAGEQDTIALATPPGSDVPQAGPTARSAADGRAAPRAPTEAPEAPSDPAAGAPRASGVTETIERALSGLSGGTIDEADGDQNLEKQVAAPSSRPGDVGSDEGDSAETAPGAAPSFDIVRIGPDGAAVIAGRAAPEAEVELRSGERVLDRVRANRRGEWVALPPEPLPGGDQALTIAARVGDGATVQADEVLVVAVPEWAAPQPATRVTAAAPRQPPPPVGAEQPTAAAGPSPSDPLAVALPRKGGGQGRILQAPGRISADGNLALMMLDYDDTGRIRLRGEASPGAPLRVYVDNQPAAAVTVEPGGQWSAVLEPTLAPGDYTLRIDQLDPSGKPTARLETPFTRVNQPPLEGDVQVDFVVVQPGNSLWRIARRLFGDGMHYVHIYDANDGQIRDPDLIYPGQVFEVPSGLGTAG